MNARFVAALCAIAIGMFAVFHSNAFAQNSSHGRNYDEAKVGRYSVPDPLLGKDGTRITDRKSWIATRRGEILGDFRDRMYGHTPDLPIKLGWEVVATRNDAVDGLATRTILKLRFFDDPSAPDIDLMLYIPNKATKPVPVLLGPRPRLRRRPAGRPGRGPRCEALMINDMSL